MKNDKKTLDQIITGYALLANVTRTENQEKAFQELKSELKRRL